MNTKPKTKRWSETTKWLMGLVAAVLVVAAGIVLPKLLDPKPGPIPPKPKAWCKADPAGVLYSVSRVFPLKKTEDDAKNNRGTSWIEHLDLPASSRFYSRNWEGDAIQREFGIRYSKSGEGAGWSYRLRPLEPRNDMAPDIEVTDGVHVVLRRLIGGLPTVESYVIYYELFRERSDGEDRGYDEKRG